MYYVMERDSSASSRFIRFREIEPEDDGEQWMTGKPIKKPPSNVVLSSSNEARLPFSDYALSDINLHIYSPKMRKTLELAGVLNIQYCPVLLRDGGDGVERDDYRIANFLDPQDCIDHGKAKFDRSSSGKMLRLKKFSLLEEKIRAAAAGQATPLLFRLAEYRRMVIAHASVKAACERDGLAGMVFTPTADYA